MLRLLFQYTLNIEFDSLLPIFFKDYQLIGQVGDIENSFLNNNKTIVNIYIVNITKLNEQYMEYII